MAACAASPRSPRIALFDQTVIDPVVAMTNTDSPNEAKDRTAGTSVSAVQRICRSHQRRPHWFQPFRLSKDRTFADAVEDVFGLWLIPPTHAIFLSIEQKSQIQAFDLRIKPGSFGTMTRDDKRHGSTTLFAAPHVLDGTVIGRNTQRHRNQQFIRFVNAVEAAVPARKLVHAITVKYASHKQATISTWLDRHPPLDLSLPCAGVAAKRTDCCGMPRVGSRVMQTE